MADKLALLSNTKEALRVKLGLGTEVPFSQYVDRVIRAPFSPLELFSGGKKGVWYDPSDLSTMFQDAAGTIPVTANGDPVGLIRDKSGNDSHIVQTVSAARPTYQTDGFLHWLQFDGVDDFLESANLVNYVGNSFYVATAMRSVTRGVLRFKDASIDEATGESNYLEEYMEGGKKLLIQRAPSLGLLSVREQTYPTDSSWVSWQANSSVFTHQIIPNNPVGNSGSASLASSSNAKIGIGTSYAGYKMNGAFYGFVWLSDTITDIERDQTNVYLAKKAGVVL